MKRGIKNDPNYVIMSSLLFSFFRLLLVLPVVALEDVKNLVLIEQFNLVQNVLQMRTREEKSKTEKTEGESRDIHIEKDRVKGRSRWNRESE